MTALDTQPQLSTSLDIGYDERLTLFSGRADRVLTMDLHAGQNLAAAPFEEIVVTDTIPMRPGTPDTIRVPSCADLLTDSIRRSSTDDSVSDVVAGENQLL